MIFKRFCLILASMLVSCAVSGCAEKSTPQVAQVRERRAKPAAEYATPTATSVPVEEDMQWFAETLAMRINSGHPSAIADGMDWEQFVDRIAFGIKMAESDRNEYLDGVRMGFTLDQRISRLLGDGGDIRLLRVRHIAGELHALYRIVSGGDAEGGLSYLELLMVRDTAGGPRIGDVYLYSLGENISRTMRRVLLAIYASRNRGLLDKLVGKDNVMMRSLPRIQAMTTAGMEDDPERALEIYATLPPEVQQDRAVLMTRISVARQVSEELYAVALEDLQRLYGNDPATNLMLLDHYMIKEQYPKVMDLIDSLDAQLGGDPYLDLLRANIFTMQGDYQRAWLAINAAMQELPEMKIMYWTALEIALQARQFDNALEVMEFMSQKFMLEFRIENIPEYAEFVASPQYQVWLQRHPQEFPPGIMARQLEETTTR